MNCQFVKARQIHLLIFLTMNDQSYLGLMMTYWKILSTVTNGCKKILVANHYFFSFFFFISLNLEVMSSSGVTMSTQEMLCMPNKFKRPIGVVCRKLKSFLLCKNAFVSLNSHFRMMLVQNFVGYEDNACLTVSMFSISNFVFIVYSF